MADLVGQQFGNYLVTRLLGRGGFADVYLGEHVHLATQVAIKILSERPNNKDLKNFQQEAQIVAHLKHPNIVNVFDFGLNASNIPFFVMDYLPNGNILTIHPRGQIVPLKKVVSYAKQIALALQSAHDAKIIHRDVKPENLLIGPHQEVLLSDFGIAVVAHGPASMTTQNAYGTIYYMAPEHCKGHPQPASDQYSLAVVVYEWLCRTYPFKGTFFEIFNSQLFTPPPPLRSHIPTIPPDIEKIVLKALAKDPAQRFPSVQAFAVALEQASSLAYHTPNQPASPSLPPVSSIPPTQGPLQTMPVSQPPPAMPSAQIMVSAPSSVRINSETSTTLSKPPTVSRWIMGVPLWFQLIWGISWIIWIVLMCLNADSISHILALKFSSQIPVESWLILLSGIVPFFAWGWIVGQNTGDFESIDTPIRIGIPVITWIISACIWPNLSDLPFNGGDLLLGILFPGLLLCLLTVPIGLVSTYLGTLIGVGLSRV